MTNPPNDSQAHVPELDPQLETAVRSILAKSLDQEAISRIKQRASDLHSASCPPPQSSARGSSLSKRFLMKCLTTVTGILLVAASLLLWQPSGTSAYGEAIKQLCEARSFSFLTRIYVEGQTDPIVSKTLVAQDGRQRQEHAGGVITILDSSSRIRLTLIPLSKTALVTEPAPVLPEHSMKHPLEWLEKLKMHGDKADKQLGKKVLEGRNVEGFEVQQGQATYTVWVDPQTKTLVQVESDMPVKGSSIKKSVQSEFRFNEKLDESLFSFSVPQGYRAQKQGGIPQVPGGEISIVGALRGYTKRSNGKFPKSISDWGEWAVLFSFGSQGRAKLDQETTETMSHLGSILPFLTRMPKENYDYLGSGKSVHDKRCLVFWYRNDKGKLRGIYNDLSVADLPEQDVPK